MYFLLLKHGMEWLLGKDGNTKCTERNSSNMLSLNYRTRTAVLKQYAPRMPFLRQRWVGDFKGASGCLFSHKHSFHGVLGASPSHCLVSPDQKKTMDSNENVWLVLTSHLLTPNNRKSCRHQADFEVSLRSHRVLVADLTAEGFCCKARETLPQAVLLDKQHGASAPQLTWAPPFLGWAGHWGDMAPLQLLQLRSVLEWGEHRRQRC